MVKTVIIKNNTDNDISLGDLSGFVIPASGTEDITDLFYFERISNALDLIDAIASGTLTINDGLEDLGTGVALNYISTHDAVSLQSIPINDPDLTGIEDGFAIRYDDGEIVFDFNNFSFDELLDTVVSGDSYYIVNSAGTRMLLAQNFTELFDTPTTYSGNAGQYLKATASGLEFVDDPGVGGLNHGDVEGFYASSVGQSSTTSTSWQTKIDMDFTPEEAGYFEISHSWLQSHEDTGVFHKTRLRVDGSSTIQETQEEFYNFKYEDGAYRIRSGNYVMYFDDSQHNLKLQWRTGDSGKAAYIKEAFIIVKRLVLT